MHRSSAKAVLSHGFRSTYVHGCRCGSCRTANNEYTALRRQQRRRERKPDGLTHGDSAYINWGCRCDVCRAAHAAQMKAWKARRVA